MDTFRTITPHPEASFDIKYSSKIALIGSCFSNHIAQNLSKRKFKVLKNPYGIIFNPISLCTSLEEILVKKVYDESHLVFHNELEHSLNHHSDFSHPDPAEVVKRINEQIRDAHDFLKSAEVLFLTLGTAWVYTYEDEIVANCHKIPNHQFKKRLLSQQEIVESFSQVLKQLGAFNPKLQVVFTLSPVRHLKDGFEENSVSKAILRAVIHALQHQHPACGYFPSYEIMMDDLRDYRFYEKDMLHPNEQAIDYIWQKFYMSYMDEETLELMTRIEKLESAIQHRSKFPNSEAHQKHLAFIEREKESLKEYYT